MAGSSPPWGLAEYKNPFSVRHLTIEEACEVPHFCLEEKEDSKKRPQLRTTIKLNGSCIQAMV